MIGDLSQKLRTIAGLGCLGPVIVGGVGVGFATRSRRNGVNFFTAVWPKLFLTVGGVDLRVIGAENLAARRPAVFIFNHRNKFDVFVTASLVRENWTAVSKKELKNDLIAGTIGRIVDAAFIDRDDQTAAVEGLRKVEELAKGRVVDHRLTRGDPHRFHDCGSFQEGSLQDRDGSEDPRGSRRHSQC